MHYCVCNVEVSFPMHLSATRSFLCIGSRCQVSPETRPQVVPADCCPSPESSTIPFVRGRPSLLTQAFEISVALEPESVRARNRRRHPMFPRNRTTAVGNTKAFGRTSTGTCTTQVLMTVSLPSGDSTSPLDTDFFLSSSRFSSHSNVRCRCLQSPLRQTDFDAQNFVVCYCRKQS